jgi:hypothetical protein
MKKPLYIIIKRKDAKVQFTNRDIIKRIKIKKCKTIINYIEKII